MRNSKNIRRKGFTLVELLIVIVVIGILSAMMMLSSTEATTSAKATAIVSNLRNIKTAALAYYADHQATATTLSKDPGSVCFPQVAAHTDGFADVDEEYILK
ncbi:MAG: type II secretion system protein, partial [Synergistaceae bacterium]|nr:type II secretion system protein [Synergistaceae bacterium]